MVEKQPDFDSKHRILLQCIQSPVVALISDFTILFCNKSFTKIIEKRSPIEIEGTNLLSIVPKIEVTPLFLIIKNVIDTGIAENSEITFEGRFYDSNIYPTPWGVIVILNDITEKKRIVNELEQTKFQFESLIEQFPAGIVVHDRKGNILFGNQKARILWGISPDRYDQILMNYNIFKDNQLKELGVMPLIKMAFTGEIISLPSTFYDPYPENSRLLEKENNPKKNWIQSQLYPIKDATGDVSVVVQIHNDVTEQKSIEKILRKERDTAQKYLDIVPVIMLTINQDQIVTMINRMGCKTLGYPENEILGKNWFDSFIPPEYKEKVRNIFQDLIRGKMLYLERFENPIMAKNGMIREISWFNTILTDEKGRITGTLSSGQDITEKKKAENDLKKSEERYRTLVSTSPEGIWVTDTNNLTTFVNPALEKLLGYTMHEILGHPVTDFLDLESIAKLDKISKERFVDKIESSTYELTFIRRDNTHLITRVSGRLIYDKNNEIVGSFAILSDITANKRAEDFLLRARDYLSEQIEKRTRDLKKEKLQIETIVETIPVGIVVINSNLEFILINKRFHEFYEKIYQNKLPKFLNEVLILKNKFGDTISKIFYSKEDVTQTIEPLKGFYLELVSSQVISQPNMHIGVVIVVRDVTPFVELDNLRKQFVSTVSHELRTPITGISLSLQNLRTYWDQFSEIEKKSLIETMNFSSEVLTQMVEDLLIISRIEAGKFNLNWQKIDLKNIVDNVLIQMDSKRVEKNITIQSNIQKYVTLLGDGKRLGQVIRILVDNAFKYSKDDSNVKIDALDHYMGKYNSRGVDGILIQVRDSGRGILEKDLPYVFDRYFRSDDIIDIPGSGVGLDIAKTIIENLFGEIYVESHYGSGSTFSIFLPRITNVKEIIDNK